MTTVQEQMVRMRSGDIFIVEAHPQVTEVRKIAQDLGLELRIYPKSVGPDQFIGLTDTLIVVDHRCQIRDQRFRDTIYLNNRRVSR